MMPDPIIFVLLIYMCKISKVMNGDEKVKNFKRQGRLFYSKTCLGCPPKRNQQAI